MVATLCMVATAIGGSLVANANHGDIWGFRRRAGGCRERAAAGAGRARARRGHARGNGRGQARPPHLRPWSGIPPKTAPVQQNVPIGTASNPRDTRTIGVTECARRCAHTVSHRKPRVRGGGPRHGQDPAHRHGRRGRPRGDASSRSGQYAGLGGRAMTSLVVEQRGRPTLPSAERGQQARLRPGHAHRLRRVHQRPHLGRLQEPAHGRHQGGQRRRPGRPGARAARLRRGHRRGQAGRRRPLDDPRQQGTASRSRSTTASG